MWFILSHFRYQKRAQALYDPFFFIITLKIKKQNQQKTSSHLLGFLLKHKIIFYIFDNTPIYKINKFTYLHVYKFAHELILNAFFFSMFIAIANLW